VILVGECNPYGGSPDYALFDEPSDSSGGRLRRRVLGLSRETYFGPLVERLNLCQGREWNAAEARLAAAAVLRGAAEGGAVVVALGRRVASALGFRAKFFESQELAGATVLSLPHPSGLSRLWNEPGARARARGALAALVPGVPWGEE
jgi:hypothetical protein